LLERETRLLCALADRLFQQRQIEGAAAEAIFAATR
jgi:hypothetical protein